MPRYRVMLRCDRTQIVLENKPTDVGFFTTRAVDAAGREQAVAKAIAEARQDLASRITLDPGQVDILVEDVSVESWGWRRFRPPGGFTFFLIGPDEADELDPE